MTRAGGMAAQEAAAAFSVEVGRRAELAGKYALLLPHGVDGRRATLPLHSFQTERHGDGVTERIRDRETERQRDRETETERIRDRENQRQRDRETERQRQRQRGREVDVQPSMAGIQQARSPHNYWVTVSD